MNTFSKIFSNPMRNAFLFYVHPVLCVPCVIHLFLSGCSSFMFLRCSHLDRTLCEEHLPSRGTNEHGPSIYANTLCFVLPSMSPASLNLPDLEPGASGTGISTSMLCIVKLIFRKSFSSC